MVTETGANTERRTPLSRERVLDAAVALADRAGIEAISMRKLGQALDVEAMALYRHVRNKDDILDGMVEVVVGQIDLVPAPERGADWKAAMRLQVLAARDVMLRHPWTPQVIEERPAPGPATLAYMEAVLAMFLDGGFSLELAHHSLHVLGSRILGFNQDLFEDSGEPAATPEAAAMLAQALAAYPRITELAMAVSHEGGLPGGCDDDVEFAFGLDLILDGLERLRAVADQA